MSESENFPTPFRRLAEVVILLDDCGDGADCGKAMHGMSGAERGGCSYCEALEAARIELWRGAE
jgi:hypothetical protein